MPVEFICYFNNTCMSLMMLEKILSITILQLMNYDHQSTLSLV